ncbi:MAG TPA: BlaI/MecI/CopY family transcriptional regulator [Oscillospiraceae bacterium]|nr:BlaI/MecI/CopY family transcriptional regulator [Oscillospiraceae bacterium]HPS33899.1 BlaI/MecI/CopY family transcriptional regulator [Oscillospiraceae bacterium]
MNLSDGEWKLMNRLWQGGPYTIMRLTEALKMETGWSKHTVITMLARLEAKGAVRHEEGERAKRYYPAVERGEISAAETESFLSRVYNGHLGGLVNAMVDQKALSKQEIDELYEILRRAGTTEERS